MLWVDHPMLNACDFILLNIVKSLARLLRLFKATGVVLCMAQIFSPDEALAQTSSYKVDLSWDAHADSTVSAYQVYYGTTNGEYTTKIAVGNATQTTISGLSGGTTYYFAVTAINTGGIESAFSNAVAFQPGSLSTSIRTSATGQMVLKVQGLIGQKYNIEASQDLVSWSVISTVTIQDGGSLDFVDPDTGRFHKRFYRTRKVP